jgi:hypothetical protein
MASVKLVDIQNPPAGILIIDREWSFYGETNATKN